MSGEGAASKALAVIDPDVMPPNPYGFTRRSQLTAYHRAWARSLPPEDRAWRLGHGGAGEDLEALAVADEKREDEREWREWLEGL